MVDVQSRLDQRNLPIDQVGVSDLRYPITVMDPKAKSGKQQTVANLSMTVSLPHHFKGTHMSRFIEVLNEHSGEVTMKTLPLLLRDLKKGLNADSARVEISFPYFVEKEAPVSRARALMEYDCTFVGESSPVEDDFVLGVKVPVTSLCPCSKEISEYGAHNQRSYVSISVRSCSREDGYPEIIWIEELIDFAESSASAPVYALLKRPDEKAVTEMAYENPVFAEDIVRGVAEKLIADKRVLWFQVKTVNHESIHNHSAFAKIEWRRN
ncbi:GTP cyclohydrolase FolE2 [Geomonas paludis]|uniref:GTP cyclohydrolase FolE2 n=1 Tax=Geomonas paludis TaxID=2740185 RepID=A0A6V8N0G7_9BACT|nr:GTP cyclohydrolase FolE2 [Geomonas paludis]UPU36628.1 GTP cyclohydrolase FolE2 [Geomonas paludis]GFO65891.1 GTP cyclohydrolase FolE2 [Geomonas paludis]